MLSFNLIDWRARAPGLSEEAQWRAWAQMLPTANDVHIDPGAKLARCSALPMMTARRLKSGSRLAAECGMLLLQRYTADAVLFSSRHGELERNLCILQALATDKPVSPIDFTLSVHNSAAGNLTIAAQQSLVCSALSAGADTFQQGLYEVRCLMQAGYRRVLMVDFDGTLPDFYHPWLAANISRWAYALALLLEAGDDLHCMMDDGVINDKVINDNAINDGVINDAMASDSAASGAADGRQLPLPQSLQFLRHWLRGAPAFQICGERQCWRWSRL